MTGTKELLEHLDLLLDCAEEHRIRVLLLPELCVDETAREHVQKRLQDGSFSSLLTVVAGSFHIWPESDRPPYNECVVLGSRGRTLWRHHKRGKFRLTKTDVQACAAMFSQKPTKKIAPEVMENIRWGTKLHILDTALGRLAVVVCADALDPSLFRSAIESARPHFLLIASMSTKSKPFVEFAEKMETLRIATLYVNSAYVCGLDARSNEEVAFAYLALPQRSSDPPTRLRWLCKHKHIRGYEFKAKKWSTIARMPGAPSSAFLLKRGKTTFGMVIDLGEHL